MNKEVEKIRAEVKRRREIHRKAKRIESAFEDNAILCYIDSLQEEPVSVWHDASEEPKSDKDIAVVTKEGFMWSRYKIEDLGRGWKQFVNDAEIDKWAYISDLINL